MKITQATLKAIIKEEVAKMFEERDEPADVAHADRVLSGEEAGEIESEKTAKDRPGVFTEEEAVAEAHCAPGKRDDDREKHDLDDLYAMVRNLERKVDGMSK